MCDKCHRHISVDKVWATSYDGKKGYECMDESECKILHKDVLKKAEQDRLAKKKDELSKLLGRPIVDDEDLICLPKRCRCLGEHFIDRVTGKFIDGFTGFSLMDNGHAQSLASIYGGYLEELGITPSL